MPQDASSLGDTPLIRALFLAEAKAGKTVTLILSALANLGNGYVICGSTREHLRMAQILSREYPNKWQFDIVKNPQAMEDALATARKGVKEGNYNWVLLDDFNLYANSLEDKLEVDFKGGYKVYDHYRRMLSNCLLRLFDLKAHVFATMHYYEVSDGSIEGQAPKKGKGIVPCLTGRAKQEVPGLFNQVIWMQKDKKDQRVFMLNPEGVWGVGSHGLPAGTREIPADLGVLLEALKGAGK